MNRLFCFFRKYYWCIYLFLVILYFVGEKIKNDSNETFYDVYTRVYYENKVLVIYMLIFMILLLPCYKRLSNYNLVLQFGKNEYYLLEILKIIFRRSISYSFVLNILFYIIIGSSTKDWLMKENILRVMLLFLTQAIGWVFIGELLFICFISFNNTIYALASSYLIVILCNMSNYIKIYKRFEYYLRIYYLMFHIEVYPSLSTFISSMFLFIICDIVGVLLAYRLISKCEYI